MTASTYAWELQRPHNQLWFPIGGVDGSGVEKSPQDAMGFARELRERLSLDGKWRICVWLGESGVGRLPAAMIEMDR